ncbi:hypothetical protein VDS41_00005, partial [Xanthomonas campestris pv. campestris]|nr:hypothetical protein [Xanthomonas campestris pv. campestris]
AQTQHQPAVHPFGLLGPITQKIVNRLLGVRDRARSLSLAREVEHATWTCPEHAAHWRYAGTHCDVCIANGFFGAAMASDAEIAFGSAGHSVHEKERATFACPSAEAACRLHPLPRHLS